MQKHELSCGITSGPLCPTVFKKNISTTKRRAHRGHPKTGSSSLWDTFSNDTLTLPLCALLLCLFLYFCLSLILSRFLCLFLSLDLRAMIFGIQEFAYTYELEFPWSSLKKKARSKKLGIESIINRLKFSYLQQIRKRFFSLFFFFSNY